MKAVEHNFGKEFVDKYYSGIYEKAQKFSKYVTSFKAVTDRPDNDPYKKRLKNWRIG